MTRTRNKKYITLTPAEEDKMSQDVEKYQVNMNGQKWVVTEFLPNTIRHIAGWGLVKGPDEESIISLSESWGFST